MGFLREFFGSSHDEEEHEELLDDEGEERPRGPTFDPVAVLNASGVSAEEQRHVTRAQELLESLPPDTPAAVERRIVEAAFRAFDVPLEDIISAARREIDAFEQFIEAGREHNEEVRDNGHARIEELEAEIARIRANLQRADEDQRTLAQAASEVIDDIRPVLSFFERDGSEPEPEAADDDEDDGNDDKPASVVIDMTAGD